MRYWYWCWLLLLLPSLGWGATLPRAEEEFFADYLRKLKATGAAVFYSQCERPKEGRVLLLFSSGKSEGLLAEFDHERIINLATVSIKANELVVEETHGGVYSYQRVKNLIVELSRYPFTLVLSADIAAISESPQPKQFCMDTPPLQP